MARVSVEMRVRVGWETTELASATDVTASVVSLRWRHGTNPASVDRPYPTAGGQLVLSGEQWLPGNTVTVEDSASPYPVWVHARRSGGSWVELVHAETDGVYADTYTQNTSWSLASALTPALSDLGDLETESTSQVTSASSHITDQVRGWFSLSSLSLPTGTTGSSLASFSVADRPVGELLSGWSTITGLHPVERKDGTLSVARVGYKTRPSAARTIGNSIDIVDPLAQEPMSGAVRNRLICPDISEVQGDQCRVRYGYFTASTGSSFTLSQTITAESGVTLSNWQVDVEEILGGRVHLAGTPSVTIVPITPQSPQTGERISFAQYTPSNNNLTIVRASPVVDDDNPLPTARATVSTTSSGNTYTATITCTGTNLPGRYLNSCNLNAYNTAVACVINGTQWTFWLVYVELKLKLSWSEDGSGTQTDPVTVTNTDYDSAAIERSVITLTLPSWLRPSTAYTDMGRILEGLTPRRRQIRALIPLAQSSNAHTDTVLATDAGDVVALTAPDIDFTCWAAQAGLRWDRGRPPIRELLLVPTGHNTGVLTADAGPAEYAIALPEPEVTRVGPTAYEVDATSATMFWTTGDKVTQIGEVSSFSISTTSADCGIDLDPDDVENNDVYLLSIGQPSGTARGWAAGAEFDGKTWKSLGDATSGQNPVGPNDEDYLGLNFWWADSLNQRSMRVYLGRDGDGNVMVAANTGSYTARPLRLLRIR